MFTWNQATTFVGMYLGYVLIVANRKSFSYLVPTIVYKENLDTSFVGSTLSSVALGYGIGKFVSGLLIDRTNPRLMFTVGLFSSGFLNILFSWSHSSWFSILYFLVGFCQGPSWPACVKIIKRWYPSDTFGVMWSVLSTSINFAASFGSISYNLLVEGFHGSWRHAMMFGGSAACIFAILSLVLIKEFPSDINLTPKEVVQVSHTETGDGKNNKVKPNGSHKSSSWKAIFLSTYLYVLCFAHFSAQMVKEMLSAWEPLYLIQEKHASPFFVSSFIGTLESGGFVGSILCGYASDTLLSKFGTKFKAKGHPRHILLIPLYVLLLVSLYLLRTWFSDVNRHRSAVMFLAFLTGFALYSIINLVGILVLDNADENVAGTVLAICSLLGNFGSMIAGLPFAMLVKSLSWSGAFCACEATIAVSVLTFLVAQTMSCRIGKHTKEE